MKRTLVRFSTFTLLGLQMLYFSLPAHICKANTLLSNAGAATQAASASPESESSELFKKLTSFVGVQAQGDKDARSLEADQTLVREIAKNEVHKYQIALSSEHYLNVNINPKEINLTLRLLSPGGDAIIEMKIQPESSLPCHLSWIATTNATYRLEISPADTQTTIGHYEIRLEQLRVATQSDRNLVAADRAREQAESLQQQSTKESRLKAIEVYQGALRFFRETGERQRESRTLNRLGIVYSNLGETEKSISYYREALAIEQSIGDRRGEATTLMDLGKVYYYKTGDLQRVLDLLNQALVISRATKDQYIEAWALYRIGRTYSALGEWRKAIENYSLSLIPRRAIGDRSWEGATLNGMGMVYFESGEPYKALDLFNQAILSMRAIGSSDPESGYIVNVADVYLSLGEWQKAFDIISQVLSFNRNQNNSWLQTGALQSLGMVYNAISDEQQALSSFNKALLLAQKDGAHEEELDLLRKMADTYFRLGEKQKALDLYNQVLVLQKSYGVNKGEAITLIEIGRIYLSRGEKQKAYEILNDVLSHPQSSDSTLVKAETFHYLGLAEYEMGRKDKALEYLNKALPLRQSIGDRKNMAETLYQIAKVECDKDQLLAAKDHLQAVIDIVESQRKNISSHEIRASYFTSAQDYYGLYIDVLMQLNKNNPLKGFDALALHVSESARARSLLEALAEVRANVRNGVDPVLRDHEHSLQNRINAKEQYRIRLLNGKHTQEQVNLVDSELRDLVREYKEIDGQIKAVSPGYAALTQPQPANVIGIQKLLDDETMLLEYSLGHKRSFLWAISNNAVTNYELPPGKEIEAAAMQLYSLITVRQPIRGETQQQYAARVAEADSKYDQQVTKLSHILIGPVAAQLGAKRLLIVADGTLQYVPFAALPVPQTSKQNGGASNSPLMAGHEIVSLPSASVLSVIRQETARRTQAAKSIAVLADPVFDKDDDRIQKKSAPPVVTAKSDSVTAIRERALRDVGLLGDGIAIPRLPFTRQEAEAITALVPTASALKALGFKASLLTARAPELSQYRVVHFATHALVNANHPHLSGLLLSLVDEEGKPQDGFLSLNEIYNLNLPADLIMLSACQTAMGKEMRGEGLIGLTRGFMYAGAQRVVASLWKVDDAATSELMKRFYRGLFKQGLRPAAALRAAQLEMSKHKLWKQPYYWAGFVLQGEWK